MLSYRLEEPDLLPSQRQTFSCFSGAGLQLSPGGESPSQLQAQEEMRMKTWLIFSVSVKKVTPECKVSNWVLSGIKKDKDISIVTGAVLKGLLIIKTPFYMESLEVIRIVINFWSFLLRNNLPSFLKHNKKKKKSFNIFHPKLENLKEKVNFPKMLDLMPFISIKSSFEMTALHFVVQLCVSQGKHLLNLTMS